MRKGHEWCLDIRKQAMWGPCEEIAICKPGTNIVSTLIMDFRPWAWGKNMFQFGKPFSLWNSARQPKLRGLRVVVLATLIPSGWGNKGSYSHVFLCLCNCSGNKGEKQKELGGGNHKAEGGPTEKEERRGEGFFFFLEAGGGAWHLIAAQQTLRWTDWEIDSWVIASCIPSMNFSQRQVLGVDSQIAGRQLMVAASA